MKTRDEKNEKTQEISKNNDNESADVEVIMIKSEIDPNFWRYVFFIIDDWHYNSIFFSSRNRLPAPMIDRSKVSIWSIAKHFIGKVLDIYIYVIKSYFVST